MELKDARVLITGGSLGIGKATAKLMADAGAKVMITARHKEDLQKAADEVGAIPFQADVSQPEDVEETFTAVQEKLGGLDVLVNNAGTGTRQKLHELDLEKMRDIYNVNVFGAANMAKRAAQIFRAQKSGNIINIASTAALKGYEGGTIYSSSKWALRGMTECWRAELRPFNVRVFLVNPSEVTTAFGQSGHQERENQPNKLRPQEIAYTIKSLLEMDNRGFIPECAVWATNPF